MKSRCGAFTLIELMIVVMLIAVMAATVAPRLAGQIRGARLRKSVRDFISLCRIARTTAAQNMRECEVVLDPGRRQMRLESADGAGEAMDGSRFRRDWAPGIRVGSGRTAVGEAEMRIGFYPDGTAEKTELVFSDLGGRRLGARVDSITGRVTVGEGGR